MREGSGADAELPGQGGSFRREGPGGGGERAGLSRLGERLPGDGEPAVRMTVADSGRGMTSEEAGKIFNDFYTTKEGGTGLGLSIVRRLVMDVQGTIGVESAPGRGTRIIIEIPAGKPRSG